MPFSGAHTVHSKFKLIHISRTCRSMILGDPFITATSLNTASKSKFSLMPMKFHNLPQISNCSKELSFYKCFGLKLLEKERYRHCPNFCIPIIWKSAIEMGTNKSLTICETFEDNYCISQSMARIIF